MDGLDATYTYSDLEELDIACHPVRMNMWVFHQTAQSWRP